MGGVRKQRFVLSINKCIVVVKVVKMDELQSQAFYKYVNKNLGKTDKRMPPEGTFCSIFFVLNRRNYPESSGFSRPVEKQLLAGYVATFKKIKMNSYKDLLGV